MFKNLTNSVFGGVLSVAYRQHNLIMSLAVCEIIIPSYHAVIPYLLASVERDGHICVPSRSHFNCWPFSVTRMIIMFLLLTDVHYG